MEAATARLAAAGIEQARGDAEWLLAGLLGMNRGALGLALDDEPAAAAIRDYEAAVGRREQREPLQRILGWEEFRGLRLALTPWVLVPRPETEILVELALALLPDVAAGRRPLVVDVGTGSGCVACAIAAERPDVDVIATDRSLESLRVARDNARRLGLARIQEVASDLLGAIGTGCADLIVSNPPYLPSAWLCGLDPEVRDHEPLDALDGGPDGLEVLGRLIAESTRSLRPGAALVVETAGGDQVAEVARSARSAGLEGVAVHRDLAGVARFVTARRA
ncbi:MAG TPA: peptide chain release factor N(5)-glutamine methyltransferase [Methylomirabilota bacterium]